MAVAVFEPITSWLVYSLLFTACLGVVAKWFYDRRQEQQVS